MSITGGLAPFSNVITSSSTAAVPRFVNNLAVPYVDLALSASVNGTSPAIGFNASATSTTPAPAAATVVAGSNITLTQSSSSICPVDTRGTTASRNLPAGLTSVS